MNSPQLLIQHSIRPELGYKQSMCFSIEMASDFSYILDRHKDKNTTKDTEKTLDKRKLIK